jgi:hypothetical protein
MYSDSSNEIRKTGQQVAAMKNLSVLKGNPKKEN